MPAARAGDLLFEDAAQNGQIGLGTTSGQSRGGEALRTFLAGAALLHQDFAPVICLVGQIWHSCDLDRNHIIDGLPQGSIEAEGGDQIVDEDQLVRVLVLARLHGSVVPEGIEVIEGAGTVVVGQRRSQGLGIDEADLFYPGDFRRHQVNRAVES